MRPVTVLCNTILMLGMPLLAAAQQLAPLPHLPRESQDAIVQQSGDTRYADSGYRSPSLKKILRRNLVTDIGDTNHENNDFVAYVASDAFLTEAQAAGVKYIAVEIDHPYQPIADRLRASRGSSLAKVNFESQLGSYFRADPDSVLSYDYLPDADIPQRLARTADLIVNAKKHGIIVLFGDKFSDKSNVWVRSASEALFDKEIQQAYDDTVAQGSLRPTPKAFAKAYIATHPEEYTIAYQDLYRTRTSRETNVAIRDTIIDAIKEHHQGSGPLLTEKSRLITMFGEAHDDQLTGAFEVLGVSVGRIDLAKDFDDAASLVTDYFADQCIAQSQAKRFLDIQSGAFYDTDYHSAAKYGVVKKGINWIRDHVSKPAPVTLAANPVTSAGH